MSKVSTVVTANDGSEMLLQREASGTCAAGRQGRHKVSVVVPVRNEERSIGRLLDSLCAQTRPADEVIICDGGSTDGTAEIIEGYASRAPWIRLVTAGPAFPGRARNLAIRAAHFDLVVLTDAGIRLDSRWLENLLAPFESPSPPDVVYGRFEPIRASFRQRCIADAFVPPRDRRSGLRGTSLASMAIRQDVWARQGGFREDLRSAEDLLFMRGISRLGFSVQYAPQAVVFWTPPRDFTGTLKRFAAYSHSNIRAGLAREWQLPLLRTYLLLAVLTLAARWTPLGLFAPLAVIGVRAAKRIAREHGLLSLLNMPLVMGVMVALLTIDLATLAGFCRWLATDWIPGALRRRPVSLAR